jgi:alanyl-tRNA synthetase
MLNGSIKKDETVTLSVDITRRRATELNHTATHILHAVLRNVLGDHVKQQGSLVAPDRLRFDFSHFSQVDAQTLEQIETLVNDRIRANVPVAIEEMEAEEAFQTGAMALFEEKYGDRVRVISLSDFSKELCGGTHTDRTGNIGLFKILSESSVASGVRRIEALTGSAAVDYMQQNVRVLRESAMLVKEKPEALKDRIDKMLQQQKAGEKEIERLKAQIATLAAGGTADVIAKINDIKVAVKRVQVDSPAELRDMADKFKDRLQSGIVVLGSAAGAKVFLIVGVTKDLMSKYKAGEIIKPIAETVGGSGGGRPDLAQAGGTLTDKLDVALEQAYEVIKKI